MGMSWRFTPPKVNAIVRVHEAGALAVRAGADHLLAASQPLVPVDTGALRDSGQVVADGLTAAVTYGQDDDAHTADYAVVQHERLDYQHPSGQAKFLEQPMSGERETVAAELAEPLRRALRG